MVRIRSEWRVAAVVGLLLFILLVAFGDRLLGPGDVVVLPFLYVPVIASAVAGSVRITASITVAAFVASALLLWSTGFDGSTPKRLIAVVVVGTTAIVLARVIGLARIRIAEKDATFRLLAENASDIVARLDRDGIIEWISPSVEDVLGTQPTDLVGLPARTLVYPPDLVGAADQISLSRDRGGSSLRMTLRLTRSDATCVWMSIEARSLDDGTMVVSARQVEEEVQAAADLARSEERFRLLAENAMDLVLLTDSTGALTWVSPSVTPVLGYAPADLLGHQPEDYLHPEDVPLFRASVLAVTRLRTSTGVMRLRRADDTLLPVEATIRAFRTPSGDLDGCVIAVRDVELEQRAVNALEQSVRFDDLTGLATRPTALDRVSELLDAPGDRTWALFCLSVDGMTTANQAYTYAAGDLILQAVARRLVRAAGQESFVARIAGNEFLVLQREIVTPVAAAAAAERILNAVRGPVALTRASFDVTACLGVALASDGEAEALLRDAHAAMRQAAQKGSDRWEFLAGTVGASTRRGLEIQSQLREALPAGDVVPWFMPIVRIEDGSVIGYEALVRWMLPDGSQRMPLDFLPMAERTGLILSLDMSMLTQALDAAALLPSDVAIGINMSSLTISSSGYVAAVRRELDRTGVDPGRVHLEVTETALVDVSRDLKDAMVALARFGVAWWVDDFGTGFSSISHLRDLPISGLKLDMSFTGALTRPNDRAARLAQGLVGLATGLGLETVAEGVETREQEAVLRGQGWMSGQGWLYGKAAPLNVATPLVSRA